MRSPYLVVFYFALLIGVAGSHAHWPLHHLPDFGAAVVVLPAKALVRRHQQHFGTQLPGLAQLFN